jgi:hypothetical protein
LTLLRLGRRRLGSLTLAGLTLLAGCNKNSDSTASNPSGQALRAVVRGTLKPGDKTFKADALGEFQVEGDNIMLGKPFIFNKDNIDQFDF